jgi:hypothetical protein
MSVREWLDPWSHSPRPVSAFVIAGLAPAILTL